MLIGEYQHAVDEKGRVALPAKFRKLLSGGVVVTKGIDSCLHIYPLEEWRRVAERLSKLPSNKLPFIRLILSQASHCEIDQQGRILVPAQLLERAGIHNRAVIVGLYTRGELWNEEQWLAHRKSVEGNIDSLAEELGELNLL